MMLVRNGTCYEGFVKVHGRRFFLHAEVPNHPSTEGLFLQLDWRLTKLLEGELKPLLDRSDNFVDFLTAVSNLAEEKLSRNHRDEPWLQNPLKTYNLYKRLEEELKQVGEYVKSIDVDEGILEIETTDVACRIHKASLKLGYNYLKEAIKIVSYDLPILEDRALGKDAGLMSVTSLSGFCKQFSSCLDMFQGFWNTVALLDSNCWILDPENPQYRDTTRRIKISDSLSIVVTFNPYHPQQRPDIKFLGCHSHVNQYRQLLEKNLEKEVWDQESDVLSNLSLVLEVDLPRRPAKEELETMDLVQPGECAICFTVRLDDEIPTQICDNPSCLSNYHAVCLFKYLHSIPTNTNFFNRIQGNCPNCDSVISCPVPDSP